MTAYLCVGGPMHGQMYEHAGFEDRFEVVERSDFVSSYQVPFYEERLVPVRHTYHRRGIGPNCIVWLHSSIPVTL